MFELYWVGVMIAFGALYSPDRGNGFWWSLSCSLMSWVLIGRLIGVAFDSAASIDPSEKSEELKDEPVNGES